ncbi:hypothetical protein ACWGIU_08650 [Streptomyces sp. NPDC054840]
MHPATAPPARGVDRHDSSITGADRATLVPAAGRGRDIDTAFALHATVRAGRVTRYHLHEDTYAVAEAHSGD